MMVDFEATMAKERFEGPEDVAAIAAEMTTDQTAIFLFLIRDEYFKSDPDLTPKKLWEIILDMERKVEGLCKECFGEVDDSKTSAPSET